MAASALRAFACATALATALLFGAGVTATAQPGDSSSDGGDGGDAGGTSVPTGSVESAPDTNLAGSSGSAPADPDRPTSTIGNGRNDVVDPNAPVGASDRSATTGIVPKPRALTIPMLRMPAWQDLASVPLLEDLLNALSQPTPQPSPAPSFRIQEADPVVEPTPGAAGSERIAASGDGPPVFRAPLVVAPPVPIAPRLGPLGASAAKGPATMVNSDPAAVGVRTPLIRGTLPPTTVTPLTRPLTEGGAQPTGVGYPRYLRPPTAAEAAAVALPGIGGLLFLTFSGGLIGYRQANSTRYFRATDAARFLP